LLINGEIDGERERLVGRFKKYFFSMVLKNIQHLLKYNAVKIIVKEKAESRYFAG
jgi:hypothetical protein